jgi:pimeloyl-ACP methyl ester carboxylesterase
MRLHVERVGDGPVRVALLHGFLGADFEWHGLVEAAGGGVTFLLVDLAGHGRSPRADAYSLAGLAADVVESLPTGLDAVVGHSLGGRVLVDAVAALRPAHAVYLDPGFRLALPSGGPAARAFWRLPGLRAALAWAYDREDRAWGPDNVARLAEAHALWDRRMVLDVLRDCAEHPVEPAPPAVPSTIVLSDDARLVVPPALAIGLERAGWRVRRLAGIRHAMHLLDARRTWSAIRDVL